MTPEERVLLIVQTACAVIAVGLALLQILLSVRLRKTRRATGDPVVRRDPEVNRGWTIALISGAIFTIVVAGYLALFKEAYFADEVSATIIQIFLAVFLTIALGAAIQGRTWMLTGAVGVLAIWQLVTGINFTVSSEWRPEGFVAIGTFMLLSYYRLRSTASTFIAVWSIIASLAFGSYVEGLCCLIIAVFASRWAEGRERFGRWATPALVFAALLALTLTNSAWRGSRLVAWLNPTDNHWLRWQVEQYRLVAAEVPAFGAFEGSIDRLWDIDGLAWPVGLLVRFGWVPTIVVVAAIGTFYALAFARAMQLGAATPLGLALALPPALFYLGGLAAITEMGPMISFAPFPFSGRMSLAAGVLWVALMLAVLLQRNPLRQHAPAPEPLVKSARTGMPITFAHVVREFTKTGIPVMIDGRGWTPLRWILIALGLADYEDSVPPPSKRRGKSDSQL